MSEASMGCMTHSIDSISGSDHRYSSNVIKRGEYSLTVAHKVDLRYIILEVESPSSHSVSTHSICGTREDELTGYINNFEELVFGVTIMMSVATSPSVMKGT